MSVSVRVGLDLSITSPAAAIYVTEAHRWYLFAFAQRVRERGLHVRREPSTPGGPRVELQLFDPIPPPGTADMVRYEHIRHHLVDKALAPHVEAGSNTRFTIESYAFGASSTSGSSYKLMELGGIIKHSLHMRFPSCTQVYVPPTAWKKQVAGSGKASKWDVVAWCRDYGPRFDTVSALQMSEGAWARPEVPNPCQDIADAVCIAMYDPTTGGASKKDKLRTSDVAPGRSAKRARA